MGWLKQSTRRASEVTIGGVLLLLVACSASTRDVVPSPAPSPPEAPPVPELSAPTFPADAGAYSPSMARTLDDEPLDIGKLADVEACAECHPDVAAQWSVSAHSRSSLDNPYYRVALDSYREEVGLEESRFCGGCHDPLLLFSGGLDVPVRGDDPLAHGGITCRVCHGIQEATPDGNGSYVLATRPIEIPRRGDSRSLRLHRQSVTPEPLRTASLCGSCHRGFLGPAQGLPHFLPGMDDAGPWRASPMAGSHAYRLDHEVEERICQDCHMPRERTQMRDAAAPTGSVSSHRFPGAQTAIAAAGGPAQTEALTRLLKSAATIDIAAIIRGGTERALPADGAPVRPGDHISFDVVIHNEGAAHAFPGGVRDTQDVWVELEVHDARGRRVSEAGTRHARQHDPTAHRVTATVLDEDGRPELRHFVQRFRALAYDHTVPPRDSRVVRYELDLPTTLSDRDFPLRVEARLRHRRHHLELERAACASTRSREGRRFAATSRRLGRPVLDACVPQPITELAMAAVWIGAGSEERVAEGGATQPTWVRLYQHAQGLSHGLQERLDEVRPSVEAAMGAVPPSDDAELARAMLISLRAAVESRQGRLEEALDATAEAEELVGEHPALFRIRGQAFARVWRWQEAAGAFTRVAELAPGDTGAWRDLARARGSAGDARGALAAAARGLALLPRDESLLRSQALALSHLEQPTASRAHDAYLDHRKPDGAPALRIRCSDEVPWCDRDRQPVPQLTMRVLAGR